MSAHHILRLYSLETRNACSVTNTIIPKQAKQRISEISFVKVVTTHHIGLRGKNKQTQKPAIQIVTGSQESSYVELKSSFSFYQ